MHNKKLHCVDDKNERKIMLYPILKKKNNLTKKEETFLLGGTSLSIHH